MIIKFKWSGVLFQCDVVDELFICFLQIVYFILQQGSFYFGVVSFIYVELVINVLEIVILDVKVVIYGVDCD